MSILRPKQLGEISWWTVRAEVGGIMRVMVMEMEMEMKMVMVMVMVMEVVIKWVVGFLEWCLKTICKS